MLHVVEDTSFEQIPEGLRTLAERGLSNARRELELTGKLNPAVYLREPDGTVEPIELDDKMSQVFFGDGERRGAFFRALRKTVQLGCCTAVVMVTDMYTGKQTEKFGRLPYEERRQIIRETPNLDALVRRGLMTRCEAVMVNVQTPEQVALIEQVYERDNVNRRIEWGSRTAKCFPQEVFEGRMKMFGKKESDAVT